MANFVTVSYGLVSRETSTSGEFPVLTISDDPWIETTGLNPHPIVGDHSSGGSFVLDHSALSAAQGAKIAELRDACANHIKVLGFVTGWQEFGYVFPTQAKDQINIINAYNAAMASGFPPDDTMYTFSVWCGVPGPLGIVADATDWDIRDFTTNQLKQIETNLHGHINNAQYYLKDKIAAVLAATTTQEVGDIVWNDGEA